MPAALFDAGFNSVQASYRLTVVAALRHPGMVLAGGAAAVLIALQIFPLLSSELIPRLRQGEFAAEFNLSEGTPLDSTGRAMAAIEGVLADTTVRDQVERATIITGEGRGGGGERVAAENLARLTVVMKRTAPAQAEEDVKARIRAVVANRADLRPPEFTVPTLFTLQTPLEVEVRARRGSLDAIRTGADQVEQLLASLPLDPNDDSLDGPRLFADTRSSVRRGNPEILIVFDRQMLDRHGLTVQQAANVLEQKLQGEVPTDFTFGDRRIDVLVEISDSDKATIQAVRQLRLADGLSLGDAARLIHVEGPAEIRRRDNGRTGVVSAVPMQGVALSVATARVRAALDATTFDGVTVRLAGESVEMEQSLDSLFGALLLAVFLVYVVMAIQFESLIQPFIILLTVPLALIGVVVALWILELPISIVVIVGVIVLAGIVVNNAIVLIDRINYNRAAGMPLDDAIIDGGSVRLRPILITTLTTVLGLLPLTGWLPAEVMQSVGSVFESVVGGSWATFGEGLEIRAPMAITVIVGLIVATVLTLVVIPVVYRIVARLTERATV